MVTEVPAAATVGLTLVTAGLRSTDFEIGEEQALEPVSRILDVVVVPREDELIRGTDGVAGAGHEEGRAVSSATIKP